MSEQTISADEIKAELQTQSQKTEQPRETLTLNTKIQESQEQNQEEQPNLTRKERLDRAYNSLDEEGKLAWNQGWRPEEFFKGKSKDGNDKPFISAKEFLAKTKETLPIANDRIKELAKELEETKKLAKEAQERIKKAEERGYQKALSDLEARQQQAVEMGDVEEFNKLKKEEKDLINNQFSQYTQPQQEDKKVVEDALNNQQPQQQSFLTPREEQILKDWSAKNSWMSTDRKLANYAIAAEQELLQTKPYLSLQERLDLVEDEVKEVFYTKFNNDRPASQSYETGSRGFGSQPKEKGFSSLPEHIKQQCNSLMQIRGIKNPEDVKNFKENYAKAFLK